jgi:hypothetical protein
VEEGKEKEEKGEIEGEKSVLFVGFSSKKGW